MKYRAEIDGLRALAVVPVILFHAGFTLFSGGFVGVDVFFVISGYLITSILIEDIENDRFSIANFYERRARRILPALFLVILTCIPFAWMWMLPNQMEDFSKSIVAVSLFVSNIYFWLESGYFEPEVEEKPLLHTWSLAVEEQYYVIFPLFLFFAWRYGKHRVYWMIVVMAALSLALSEWEWRHRPTANFYLTPTRVWELFSGSIAAFIVRKQGVQSNNFLSLLGLAAIFFAIFYYDEATPFPSLFALVPVLGVVLLILFASKETLVAKVLSINLFVGIGLISYSAYLWHQPLFAFARIKSIEEPSSAMMGFLSLVSLLLAVISWRYIERPFRVKNLMSSKTIFYFTTIGLVTFMMIGVIGTNKNLNNLRFNQDQLDVLAYEKYERGQIYKEGECFLDEKQSEDDFGEDCIQRNGSRYFVWGDSHAAALASGIRFMFGEISQRNASGCPPILNIEITVFQRPSCRAINEKNLHILSAEDDFTVVLHANWQLYKFDMASELEKTIEILQNRGVAKIIVVGGVPLYEPSLPQLLLKRNLALDNVHAMTFKQENVQRIDVKLAEVAKKTDVIFVSSLSVFCDEMDICKVVLDDDERFVPSAWDSGHLTLTGAKFLASRLFDKD